MTDLNLPRRTADGAGGVGKEELFLVGGHEAEELAWLGIVIGVFSMIPVVGSALQAEGRFGKFRLLLPFAVTIGLVAEGTAMITVNPHSPVAVVAVGRTPGRVHRDKVVVHSQSIPLRVAVGEEPPLQHLVR